VEDLKIELEESYTLPATEAAADSNYVEPDGLGRGKICAFQGSNVRGILMGFA